jgi:hypothetical protein
MIIPIVMIGQTLNLNNNGNTAVPAPCYYNANFVLTKDDWLSWRVANLSGARNVVIGDIKIVLTKLAKQ